MGSNKIFDLADRLRELLTEREDAVRMVTGKWIVLWEVAGRVYWY